MGFEGSLKGSLSGAIRKGCKLYWVQYCVIGVITGLVQGFSQCTLQDLIVVIRFQEGLSTVLFQNTTVVL